MENSYFEGHYLPGLCHEHWTIRGSGRLAIV